MGVPLDLNLTNDELATAATACRASVRSRKRTALRGV
jgi:hypothetical protein